MTKSNTLSIGSIGLLVMQLLLFTSCQKDIDSAPTDAGATLQIRFNPVVDGTGLVFGGQYINPSGESFSISAFKFYIHQIELIHSQRTGDR